MTREQYDELSAPLVRVLLDMEDDPRSLAEELVDTGKDCMVIFELQALAEEAESDESDGI